MVYKNFNESGFELLNSDEMLQIRGGADVPKPISRPREVWEQNISSFAQRNAVDQHEETFLTVLLNWLKK